MKKLAKIALSVILALAVILVPMTVMAAAGDSEYEPITLSGSQTTHNYTVAAGATVYFSYMADGKYGRNEYTITVSNSTRSYDYYLLTQHPMTGMVNMQNFPNPMAVAMASTTSSMMGSVVFAIQNIGTSSIDFTITTEIVVPLPGSTDFRDTSLVLDTPTTVECLEKNFSCYYYTWTATKAGTFNVTIDESSLVSDWEVGIQYVEKTDGSTDWTSSIKNKSSGDQPTATASVEVGDVVYFYVGNFDLGNITFTATVTEGQAGGGEDIGGDIGGGDIGGGDEVNYAESNDPIVVGDNALVVDSSYQYTVYTFAPAAVGEYTFTTSDSVMGIVSYTDMWVTTDPSADNVNATTLTWKCTDENQAIMIAVMANTNIANITVTKAELNTDDDNKPTVYENKFDVADFVLPEEIDEEALLESYVDTFDDVADDAVLGDDGYYHLNDKNGPVLFVNLNDELMPLAGMFSVAANNVNYTTALGEYIAALPVQTDENGEPVTNMWGQPVYASYWYPLTVDLIEIFKEVGNANGWYGTDGFVGGELDDAWMFACYYDEAVTSLGSAAEDEDNGSGSDTNTGAGSTSGSGSNTGNNNNVDTSTKSPATSDSTFALAVAMTAAAVLVIKTKKVTE